MSNLKKLRELDPELTDWWIARRREMWNEVGLVRPVDIDDVQYNIRVARTATIDAGNAIRRVMDKVKIPLLKSFNEISEHLKYDA